MGLKTAHHRLYVDPAHPESENLPTCYEELC